MKNKLVLNAVLTILVMLSALSATFAQSDNDRNKALASADTSYFSVNKKEGWQLYNSYASNVVADSTQLEVILQHDAGINWQNSNYIGKLKGTAFKPQTTRLAQFTWITTVFEVQINTDGNCYMRLVSGPLPQGNPVVIPVRMVYKK